MDGGDQIDGGVEGMKGLAREKKEFVHDSSASGGA